MYNKLFIFDLDGVLINSRELHFDALNYALAYIDPKYIISKEEHLSTYDGLPTRKKLEILTKEKGLEWRYYDVIYREKQEATQRLLQSIQQSDKLISIFSLLKSRDYKIAIASNAIKDTISLSIQRLGLTRFVDCIVSNEDVVIPKPYPEMYWKCMRELNAIPSTTIIVEDSHIGRQGAIDSGATLLPVENEQDLTMEKIMDAVHGHIQALNNTPNIPWRDKKLNVLIPMAGAGTRFAQAGYTFPKPLIDVAGKPMIQRVVENLNIEANYIFLVQKEHYEHFQLKYLLNLIAPNCEIIQIDGLTEGAASTTLLAKDLINNDNSLLIANSDQIVEWNSNECMYAFSADRIDGGILTFTATHPKWSFVKRDASGFVCEVAEKKPISDEATVGIYYWKRGRDYVTSAERMIAKDIRTNGEFYIAPTFNEIIAWDGKIRAKKIEKMWGVGTPEDLNYYLEHGLKE